MIWDRVALGQNFVPLVNIPKDVCTWMRIKPCLLILGLVTQPQPNWNKWNCCAHDVASKFETEGGASIYMWIIQLYTCSGILGITMKRKPEEITINNFTVTSIYGAHISSINSWLGMWMNMVSLCSWSSSTNMDQGHQLRHPTCLAFNFLARVALSYFCS